VDPAVVGPAAVLGTGGQSYPHDQAGQVRRLGEDGGDFRSYFDLKK
jgi:hypothetical protein